MEGEEGMKFGGFTEVVTYNLSDMAIYLISGCYEGGMQINMLRHSWIVPKETTKVNFRVGYQQRNLFFELCFPYCPFPYVISRNKLKNDLLHARKQKTPLPVCLSDIYG